MHIALAKRRMQPKCHVSKFEQSLHVGRQGYHHVTISNIRITRTGTNHNRFRRGHQSAVQLHSSHRITPTVRQLVCANNCKTVLGSTDSVQ